MTEEFWPQPSHLKSWTDSGGKVWRRIGNDVLEKKAVRRLIHDPAVRVVLFYGLEPTDIEIEAREALWARMEPVMSGKPTDNPFEDFVAYKYRDDARTVMLAIEEYC
ncbi:MAG TPA: hypothetical protein VGX49_03425 [Jatrophihabitans sp.]|nr:hypothetical protein [Jatrophihabitans sp.]